MDEPTADRRATAQQVATAFLTPSPKSALPSLDFLPRSRRLHLQTSSGKIAAAEAGHGPAVLLVHGWEGKASDMAAFAAPLLDRGYRVIAIDLPAHGESQGTQTSIPASARALVELQPALGPLHAAIAHSVGTAVLVEAMASGLQVGRAVLVAAPAHYLDHATAFAAQAGLDARETADMLRALEQRGVDVHKVSMPLRAPTLQQPALFLHSADDRIVPISDAAATARAWPGARLQRFEGLGHRRILQAPAAVAAALAFVAHAGPSEPSRPRRTHRSAAGPALTAAG
jgi:pimeloyl-ACP methyl ester carboxylesterase